MLAGAGSEVEQPARLCLPVALGVNIVGSGFARAPERLPPEQNVCMKRVVRETGFPRCVSQKASGLGVLYCLTSCRFGEVTLDGL